MYASIRELLALCVIAAMIVGGLTHCASNSRIGSAYSSLLSADNTEAGQLRAQGLLAYQRGDLNRAINLIEAGYILEPEARDTRSRSVLYSCYIATGDYKKALITANLLAIASPYSSSSYLQLGLAQLWGGDSKSAIQSFLKGLEFEAHSPRIHFYKGIAEELRGNIKEREKSFGEAEAEYQKILSQNPQDFAANYELAFLYLYSNHNVEKAPELIQNLHTAVGVADDELPEDRRLFFQYYLPLLDGIVAFRQGNAVEALKNLYAALSNSPAGTKADLAEIYYYIGQSHSLVGAKARAKLFLERSLVVDPMGPYANSIKLSLKSK